MSEIKDLHEQIENIQKMLIKKRLEHLDSIKGSNETINMSDVRIFDSDDFSVLMQILRQEGLTEGSGYIQYQQEFDLDEFADNVLMKINGQVYEFTLESSNMFYGSALTGKPNRDTDNLVDIDLDELLQIDPQLQDASISQLSEELAEKRKAFMTLKVSTAIKDIQDGKEPSSDTELVVHREEDILLRDMLYGAGFREDTDYIIKYHHTKWEIMTDRNPSTIYIRVGDNIIKYDEASGKISKETSIQDLEEHFKDDDIDKVIEEEKNNARTLKVIRNFRDEPDEAQLLALSPIQLEGLEIAYEKGVAMDDKSDSPKTYTEEELSDKYSEYVQIGEEYSYDFNRLLNVAKNLISLKKEIISGKVENREFGDPLTVDFEFIDDLVEILDENGLSCYGRYEWEDNDLYVGEVNTVTTLSMDGYEFTFNEGDGSISHPHVEKEEYGSSVPVFEFDKVIEIIDAKIEEIMKNRYSSLDQNQTSADSKSMADLTVEELQSIINENDSTINGNDEAIKQALIARILQQQRTIEEQQTEIDRLKGQKEL